MSSRVTVSSCTYVGHCNILRQVPIRFMEFSMEYKHNTRIENWLFHQDGSFYFTSSHSVNRYQCGKYPHGHVSHTPIFRGVFEHNVGVFGVRKME
jgi:hypothetical protein